VPPGIRTPNPPIKSPLLCSILLSELLSNNDSTCRELLFCPVAGNRCALRVPDAAGAYRGIRATMEQPWAGIGLDHWAEVVRGAAGRRRAPSTKVQASGAAQRLICDPGPARVADTLRDSCWRRTRSVGSDHALGSGPANWKRLAGVRAAVVACSRSGLPGHSPRVRGRCQVPSRGEPMRRRIWPAKSGAPALPRRVARSRGSRTVLPAAAGATPAADSPRATSRGDGTPSPGPAGGRCWHCTAVAAPRERLSKPAGQASDTILSTTGSNPATD
jgi:hypothetical protein